MEQNSNVPVKDNGSDVSPKLLLKQAFAQRLSNITAMFPRKLQMKKGNPIYTKEDISKTINPVARLLRMIFVDKQITDTELSDTFRDYCEQSNKLPRQVNTDKGNLKKTLSKNRMTIKQFENIIHILGLQITDIAYTLKDPKTGEITTYKLSDTGEYELDNDDDI